MKWLLLALAALAGFPLAMAAGPAAGGSKIFTFPYHMDDLDNGMRVVTVPLPYPDLVALFVVVRAGSRNEVEPGKSGFAHFFEHMMFRGTDKYPPEKYNEILKVMGASHNAFTTDDYTAYHMVFGKRDLETAMELEADRFRNLKYPLEAFRTEAKAVLGEYNKNSANPVSKLFEVIRDKSYVKHTYKHTTMGFLKDIEDMPNQFEYSRTFFDRFYRPENVVLIIAGDTSREQVLPLARRYWDDWKRGGFTQQIPEEPPAAGPHAAHIEWNTDTLPWVAVAYRGPSFSDDKPDMAALDLAAQIAFSESSPLYRRLVIEEQKVDNLFSFFRDSRDPGLLFVGARVKQDADLAYVRDAILETIEDLKNTPVSASRLDAVKSNLKYGFALSMDNTESVARQLAGFMHLSPTPETINKVYALYDALTPETIRTMARTYFTEQRRTIGTLAGPGKPEPPPVAAASRGAATPAAAKTAGLKKLLRPSQVPLVSVRVLFGAGAANDPEGREGLASLTAAMLSRGGSRTMSYEKIVEAMYPMSTDLGAQVDKEMTVFAGTTHADNLDAWYRIVSSMLLDPGFDEEDFRRVKDDAVNYLKVNLRGNNDEELGKEALYIDIYGKDHPYGHENTGTLTSLAKITLDDVKDFYRKHYTRANLTLALAGGYDEAVLARMESEFSKLPEGTSSRIVVPQAKPVAGQRLTVIRKDTRSTAISFGFPIEVNRAHKDWAALWLATSYLGQHRSSNSHLYQRMREVRGLNYGDYAYLEHFPRGMFQFQPDANLARQRQVFQVWIRPVEPENGHFALRIALFELKKLIENGLSQEDFENTRSFLDKYASLMATRQSAQLGYSLDGEYYGTGEFVSWVRGQLASLTRDRVNQAIRSHLSWENVAIIAVTKDAEALRAAIVGNKPSPIAYNAPKPPDVLEEDKRIERFALKIGSESAKVVDIDRVFED